MTQYHLTGISGVRRLELMDDDCLWLCRMIVGERGSWLHDPEEVSALLWAIAYRYLAHPGVSLWLQRAQRLGIEGSEFVRCMRLFSQPINPRWAAGGDLARKYAGKPPAAPARLKRRAQISAMPPAKIPSKIRRDVGLFRRGLLPPPEKFLTLLKPKISNWASYKGVAQKFPGGVWIGGNWFFEDAAVSRAGMIVVSYWE